mgnify:FL=1
MATTYEPAQRNPWLFSPAIDLSAFLGSALISLLLLAVGGWLGLLASGADSPDWTWVPFVLLVDVAHVYATGFRVYLDTAELRRRPLLYAGAPLVSLALGTALYSEGPQMFWRVLAYLAVFHFVRQQYGWVALYRARLRESDGMGKWIDTTAIYAATIYPLIYWHAHLPREFWWFLDHDFAPLPAIFASIARPVYWTVLLLYAGKSAWQWYRNEANPGKDIVVITTALCWYLGIVTFNSDYAFTVTNVIIHGVPYIVLVYWYMKQRAEWQAGRRVSGARLAVTLIATIWLLAYLEELVWDRLVWHERSWLFGTALEAADAQSWLVPLLAVPQLTHYILDGFIWRRRQNPNFRLM